MLSKTTPKTTPEPYFARNLGKKPKTTPIRGRWNDLPDDLAGEIMVMLSSADRIRFAACCKKLWSNYNRGEIDQLPWLVRLCTRLSKDQSPFCYFFNLFDPTHKTPYSESCVREVTGQEGFSSDGLRLLCSRNSWLLSYWRKQIFSHTGNRMLTSLVLVSPFTKQIIGLPDLDHTSRSLVASYSSNPSLPDCVYCVLSETDYRQIMISTCRNGDSVWKTSRFDGVAFSIDGLVYHKGSFYCVSHSGCIAAYNVVQNKWRLVTGPKPAIQHKDFSRRSYLLVCEGKLVFVFLDVPNSDKNGKEDRCSIFENRQRGWVEKTSLGDNYALFLCGIGSFSVSMSSELANRIYYYGPGGGKKKYYSLEDCKAYECESSCWPGVDCWGTWIEPPQLHSCAAFGVDTIN